MHVLTSGRRLALAHRWSRATGLGLVLAVLFFAGGYAAGQDHQPASAPGLFPFEREAAPLAGGVGVITPEQLLAIDLEEVQLVDVRSREAFSLDHATGAISMPEAEMVQAASELPKDRTLVLYCSCPDEKTSLRAARTLVGVFHVGHVVVLKGGLDAYRLAGGAVTTATVDSGVEHQGCGCSTNAPAFKLWIINNGEQSAESDEQLAVGD